MTHGPFREEQMKQRGTHEEEGTAVGVFSLHSYQIHC